MQNETHGGPSALTYRDILFDRSGVRVDSENAAEKFGPRVVRAAWILEALAAIKDEPRPLEMPRRLFVSYRWGTDEENEWVSRLVGDLRVRGNDVVFDRDEPDVTTEADIARLVGQIANVHEFVAVVDPRYVKEMSSGEERIPEDGRRVWERANAPGGWKVLRRGWVYDEYQVFKLLSRAMRIRWLGLLRAGERIPPGYKVAGARNPGSIVDVRSEEQLRSALDRCFSNPSPPMSQKECRAAAREIKRSEDCAAADDVMGAYQAALAAVSLAPKAPDARRRLTVAALRCGALAEAREAAEEAVELHARAGELRYLWALTRVLTGEAKSVLPLLGELAHVEPGSWRVHTILAAALSLLGQTRAARCHMNAVRKLDSAVGKGLLRCAESYGHSDVRSGICVPVPPPEFRTGSWLQVSQIRNGKFIETNLDLGTGYPGERGERDIDRVVVGTCGPLLPAAADDLSPRVPHWEGNVRCDCCESVWPVDGSPSALCTRCGASVGAESPCNWCHHHIITALAVVIRGGMSRCPYCHSGRFVLE